MLQHRTQTFLSLKKKKADVVVGLCTTEVFDVSSKVFVLQKKTVFVVVILRNDKMKVPVYLMLCYDKPVFKGQKIIYKHFKSERIHSLLVTPNQNKNVRMLPAHQFHFDFQLNDNTKLIEFREQNSKTNFIMKFFNKFHKSSKSPAGKSDDTIWKNDPGPVVLKNSDAPLPG